MGIRFVLADDHRIMREGLAAMLRQEQDFEIAGQADDGAQLVRLARKLQPDIVITDISMPGLNGIEAIRRILEDTPGVKVLCLSVHCEKPLVTAVMDAGAAGYLLKDCMYEELVRAVRAILAQQVYISPGVAGVLMQAYRERQGAGHSSAFSALTGRELEVVQLIAEGHSTKAIAERMHVSAKTVGTHREHILQKLRLNGTADLTRYAIQEGIVSVEKHLNGDSMPA